LTGSEGFPGGHVATHFDRAGHEIAGIDKRPPAG
jgi:nucleoside-diphosphate-sugar epimerase